MCMQISHEVPFSLLDSSRVFNDYDYALVHLFEEFPNYFNFFKESLNQGRQCILDNSVFELETAFDSDKFAYWINELKPTYYIIPDSLDNSHETMHLCTDWIKQYRDDLNFSKTIGVIQGQTLNDALQCYRVIAPLVDKVAVSFNCKFYENMFEHNTTLSTLEKWMYGRQQFMDMLIEYEYFLGNEQPFHLLGCSLPQEFLHYKVSKFSFIDTIDTSNPIVHAINNIRYNDDGLTSKISTKLINYLHHTQFDFQLLEYNITKFKQFCK